MSSDREYKMSKAERTMNYVDGETRIVLIGKTGSGKSSTANTLLGKGYFESKMSSVSITKKTSSKKAQFEGRNILIIDTPGLFDTETANSEMKEEIMKCVAIAAPGLHAVVLVTKIGRFTEEEKNNIQEFKKYFGEDLGQYLIIVFTGKDDLDASDTSLKTYLVEADPVLKKVVEECYYRCLAVNNRAGKEEKIRFRRNLLALVDDNVRRNGGTCYTNDLLVEAEMFMKQAEAEKIAELKEEKRKEREETTRKMRMEHEAQMEEMKRANQKQFDIIKQDKDELEERLCKEREQMKENNLKQEERLRTEREHIKKYTDELEVRILEERRAMKENYKKRCADADDKESELKKWEEQIKEREREIREEELKKREEEMKGREKEIQRREIEKAVMEEKIRIGELEMEKAKCRLRAEAAAQEETKNRLANELRQKEIEEEHRYHLQLQEEARQRARQDVEEEKSTFSKILALAAPLKSVFVAPLKYVFRKVTKN